MFGPPRGHKAAHHERAMGSPWARSPTLFSFKESDTTNGKKGYL